MITAKNWKIPKREEIDQLIKSTGCSKAELGKRIGYSQRAVEKWANGQNKISFCVWFTIKEIVKENAEKVLGGAE